MQVCKVTFSFVPFDFYKVNKIFFLGSQNSYLTLLHWFYFIDQNDQ